MSVKRKFRKSKKTKGKSNKNKKYNNEKRSKIQRKTKKRVLRGGRGELCTRGNVVHSQLTDLDRFRGKEITYEQCIALIKEITEKQSKCLTKNAKKELEKCGVKNIDDLFIQNDQTLGSNISEPAQVKANDYFQESLAEDDRVEVNPEAPREKINTSAPTQAALQDAEAIKMQKIKEAEGQVAIDSDVPISETPYSTQTLDLSKRHEDLAGKYKNLEENEQDPDIKKIYKNAKEYHNRISSKLWITFTEQEETEKSKTSVVKNNDSEANDKKEPEPELVRLNFDDDDDLKVEPIELEIDDKLQLFPTACFGKSGKCITELETANNQSFFCYQYLTIIISTFIKDSKKIDFKNLLSFHKPVFDSKLLDVYLKFFNFYNQYMAAGDEKKKFIVATRNGKFLLDGTIIAMQQYPEIDSITFLRNCYELYKLSLPIVCSYRLAFLAYNTEEIEENITTENVKQIAKQISSKNPTKFSPTDLDEKNLQKIIDILEIKFKEYSSPGSGETYESVLRDLRKYNPILSSLEDFSSSILPIPPALPPAQYQDQPHEQSLLEVLKFIDQYLISPKTTTTCVIYDTTGGATTPANIRTELEKILKDHVSELENLIANEDIFKTGCRFIADNSEIKEAIIKLIDSNNTKLDSKNEFEKKCAEKSKKFLEEAANPANDFKTNIFFHMIIYACYMTSVAPKTFFLEKPEMWNTQGTDLMILYMNEFVARFFLKILDQAIQFYQHLNTNMPLTPVILMDNNTFYLFSLLDSIKENIGRYLLKEKMNVPISQPHYENFIAGSLGQLKLIQDEIEEKIRVNNSTQYEFIESLNFKPGKESSRLQKMYEEGDLKQEMVTSCRKLQKAVEDLYDREFPEKRKKWVIEKLTTNPRVFNDTSPPATPTTLKDISHTPKPVVYTSEDKEKCKQFVVTDLIVYARELKSKKIPPNSVVLKDDYLDNLNTCCDPSDIFSKGEDSREYFKRISRAYYGLSEIWPYINYTQKPTILNLPGVNALIEKFKKDPVFQEKVKWQCNDDGKAEKKGGLRWWGKSKNRKDIIEHINPNDLQQICEADVTLSELNKVLTEPVLVPEQVSVQQAVIQQETQETPQQREAILKYKASTERVKKRQAEVDAQVAVEAANKPTPFVLTPEEKENNLLWRALANLDIIANPGNATTEFSVRDAQKAIEVLQKQDPLIYTKAELIKRTGAARPKLIPEGRPGQAFVESRRKKDQQTAQGTHKPPNIGFFGSLKSIFAGGTISTKNKTKHSTKTKHKSNHQAKAKTQSKPKHKNKSKSKSKPKHRAKTIKKNKRAHHKFDKKYTRKC